MNKKIPQKSLSQSELVKKNIKEDLKSKNSNEKKQQIKQIIKSNNQNLKNQNKENMNNKVKKNTLNKNEKNEEKINDKKIKEEKRNKTKEEEEEELEDEILNQIIQKAEKQKNKPKHITINKDLNIEINYNEEEEITKLNIFNPKKNKISSFKEKDIKEYEKLLKSNKQPKSILIPFNKENILIDENYISAEFKEEEQLCNYIPKEEDYEEEDEEEEYYKPKPKKKKNQI